MNSLVSGYDSPVTNSHLFSDHCSYSVRCEPVPYALWYQRRSLAPFWLPSRLLVLRFTISSTTPSAMPVTWLGNHFCNHFAYWNDCLQSNLWSALGKLTPMHVEFSVKWNTSQRMITDLADEWRHKIEVVDPMVCTQLQSTLLRLTMFSTFTHIF